MVMREREEGWRILGIHRQSCYSACTNGQPLMSATLTYAGSRGDRVAGNPNGMYLRFGTPRKKADWPCPTNTPRVTSRCSRLITN